MDRLFNPIGTLIIEDVLVWMDGGSVTLKTVDSESNKFEIEFVQKVFLERTDHTSCPGALFLDKQEVAVRSDIESTILTFVKEAKWGQRIVEHEKQLLGDLIAECVDFVKSDKYIEIARAFGRIN
jgi:hypothetical protein